MNLWAERIVCRLIGCRSIFARWFEWPHGVVCSRLTGWASDETRFGRRLADHQGGLRDLRFGRVHTWREWDDLEADGQLCLGYANGRDGEHEHWPLAVGSALD